MAPALVCSMRSACAKGLERNVLVGGLEIVRRPGTGFSGGSRAGRTVSARAEQDDSRIEAADPDLRDVALDPVLVGVLVVLDGAFHVQRLALGDIVPHDLGGLAEDFDAVPFRLLLFLAGLVGPAFRGGEREVGDGLAGLGSGSRDLFRRCR